MRKIIDKLIDLILCLLMIAWPAFLLHQTPTKETGLLYLFIIPAILIGWLIVIGVAELLENL